MSTSSVYITPTGAPILHLATTPPVWYSFNTTSGMVVTTRQAPSDISQAFRLELPNAVELFPTQTLTSLSAAAASLSLGTNASPSQGAAQWHSFLSQLLDPSLQSMLLNNTSWYQTLSATLSALSPDSTEHALLQATLSSQGSLLPGSTSLLAPPKPVNVRYTGSSSSFESLSLLLAASGVSLDLSPSAGYVHTITTPTGTVSWSNIDALSLTNGNDNVRGSRLNDQLYGARGHDILDGGAGDDTLYGGAGNDLLKGGSGTNELYGGDGHDTLLSISASDLLLGGSGNDSYILRNSDSTSIAQDELSPSGGYDTAYLYGKEAQTYGIEKIIISNQLTSYSDSSPTDALYVGTQTASAYAQTGVSFIDKSTNDLMLTGTDHADSFAIKLNSNDTLVGGAGTDTVHFQDPVFLNMDNTAWSLTRTEAGLRYANASIADYSLDMIGVERIILSNQDDAVALDFNNLLAVDPSTGLATKQQDFSIFLGGTASTQSNYAYLYGYTGQYTATVNGSGGADYWRAFDIKNLVLSDKAGGSDTYVFSGNTSVAIRDTGGTSSDIDTLQFSFFSSLSNITINRNSSGKITSIVDTSNDQTTHVSLIDPSITTPFERFSVGFSTYNSLSEFEAAIAASRVENQPPLPTLIPAVS